jgi:hypothetical protein
MTVKPAIETIRMGNGWNTDLKVSCAGVVIFLATFQAWNPRWIDEFDDMDLSNHGHGNGYNHFSLSPTSFLDDTSGYNHLILIY